LRLSDPLAVGDAGEYDDDAGRGQLRGVDHRLPDAGALDHDVGRDRQLCHGCAVVLRAEVRHQAGLRSLGDQVDDVRLEAALVGEQGREEPDRPGAGDQRDLGSNQARAPIRTACSNALASTEVGSSSRRNVESRSQL
jgi:hypothetical protein